MDHEFGTMKMAYPDVGWDWFSVNWIIIMS